MDLAERLRWRELLSQPGITLITVDADVIRQAEARSTPVNTAIPPQRFHSIGFSTMLPATSDRRRITFSNPLRSVRTQTTIFEKTLVWPLEDGDETAFGQA